MDLHTSVMVEEFLKAFQESHITTFYEGTVGAGGHAKALLERHPEIKRYIACDQDPQALSIAAQVLKPWKDKVEFVHGNFSDLGEQLKEKNIKKVDGFFLISESLLCN